MDSLRPPTGDHEKNGAIMHLTKSEDQLFNHWLREDLRRAIWSRDQAIRNREDLKGIAGTNIDYASTVQMLRAKKTKRRGEKLLNHVRTQVSMNLEGMRIKKGSNQRGNMRSILGGAVPTGEKIATEQN